MPRKQLIRTAAFPYHVTNRSNNREFFYIPLPFLWQIFLKCFEQLEVQFNCQIHAFVLMSNHYHLIISTPDENIGAAMKYLHREVARKSNRETGRTNHFFGGRYKWSVIDSEYYYWNAVKYIFRNPVRASICSDVENYSFSSLNSPAIYFDWKMIDFFKNRTEKIDLCRVWLNESFPGNAEEALGRGLRRRQFQLPGNMKRHREYFDAHIPKKGTVT